MSKTIARGRVLAAAALFSTGGAAIKLAAASSSQIAGLRSAIAALFLLAVLPGARPRADWRELAVVCGYALTLVLFVAANRLTTATHAIFLQMSAPLYLLALGPRVLGEPNQRGDGARIAAIAIGVLLLLASAEAPASTAPDPLRGDLCAAASGISWALTLVGLRSFALRGSPGVGDPMARIVVGGNALAAAVTVPFAFPLPTAPLDWAIVAYLGIFQIGIAYLFVLRGLRELRALEVSLLLAIEPVLNTLLSWAVHGERPGPTTIVGSAIIFAASASQIRRDAHAPQG